MAEALSVQKPLMVGSCGKKSTGWWGVWTLIATEASLFGYLLLSYFYLYFQTGQYWPPEGHPKLLMPGINTIILLSSSIFVWLAERGIRRNLSRGFNCGMMAIAILLGIIFVGVQLREWHNKPYGINSHLYGSLYFTITGFHLAHVLVGLMILLLLTLWTWLGYFNDRRHSVITIGGLYWHFVDVVWIFIFSSLYLVPYLPVK
jgi:cytochrome c oxidase subunit 3